jgi:rhomboid family GlyGly-CTERM serine protease
MAASSAPAKKVNVIHRRRQKTMSGPRITKRSSDNGISLPSTLPSWDGALLLALVVGLNLHLAGIGAAGPKIFLPAAVADGQWWRLLTHPFVHVSWYHLLLDAGAFFLLYAQMGECTIAYRFFCLTSCTLFSLLVALLLAPQVANLGLGGLSGTAHGLMVYCGLAMMRNPSEHRMGMLICGLVIVKSLWEAFSGQVVFGFMHLGACGTPLAACHLGGVLGGALAGWLLRGQLSASVPGPTGLDHPIGSRFGDRQQG